ncbi:MAG: Iron-sulfur cluster regulator SufR [Cyanobacteria bacterium RYN_339]|nr:Iron-sulfur cluster regulator SufR [Cyanobacteria bacterium RYN_339]
MESMPPRQQALLRHLHDHPNGLTIDDLAEALDVSRPAVRQHLSAFEAQGLVAHGPLRRTAGRPVQTYLLAGKGRERFPRQYTWLAGLMIKALAKREGAEGLEAFLREVAGDVADGLEPRFQGKDRLAETVTVMNELGFNARQDGPAGITATNCIYRALAQDNPQLCAFDLELLRRLAGADVTHEGCMLRGSDACCFRFA